MPVFLYSTKRGSHASGCSLSEGQRMTNQSNRQSLTKLPEAQRHHHSLAPGVSWPIMQEESTVTAKLLRLQVIVTTPAECQLKEDSVRDAAGPD
mmetsp:Transcript_51095/g.108554  ORF Transcript_51095/g.108554 Transcript_51095/m.108554 type:complete len:94 (+) Transcript_51095:276-557(+)